MNRSEFLAFFKAPFKERFLLACVLGLPLLLATPLIFSLFQFIYGHVDAFLATPSDKEIENLLYSWFIGQNAILTVGAASGAFIAFVLISGFSYMLGHLIVKQRGEIFDFKPVSMTGMQIVIGILKTVSYSLWGAAYGLLCILAMMALPALMLTIGGYIPSLFSILLWIFVVVIDIALLIWMILNTCVSNFRFIVNLKTRVFFQFRENYLYLKKYKSRFFIAWALCWVCGVIIGILSQTFYSWIISAASFLQGLLLGLKVQQPNVVVILGLLAAIAVTAYLTLLRTTFIAKSIVWIEQEQSKPQTKVVAHQKSKKRKK